jgi:hypothetical protein
MLGTLAAVSGFAIVVAITTLPVLAVIAVLLESGKAARGWSLTCGYAIALTGVFTAASFGLSGLPFPHVRIRGGTELAAGVLLLVGAIGFRLWRRSRTPRAPEKTPEERTRNAHPLTGLRAGLLGVQFAFHPENLALTFAAAAHAADLAPLARVATAILFAVVGVSTVAVPTVLFAVAGSTTRARMERLRDGIRAHGVLLADLLIAVVGVALIAVGLWRVLSL